MLAIVQLYITKGLSLPPQIWYNTGNEVEQDLILCERQVLTVANKDQKDQKKAQKAAPKSNKQKKEAMKEKKAAKSSSGLSSQS